jgi:lipopolysaccharide transport system ATP-binding protein
MINSAHLSKQPHLGQIGGTTLRDELQRLGARLRRREDPTRRIGAREYGRGETFLALDDVSFDVMPGERVGIIGRNGAE